MSAPATALAGIHKVAILLVSLGDNACAELLKHLTEDEVQRIMEAVAQLRSVPEEQCRSVLEEFRSRLSDPELRRSGGLAFAKRALTAAFGSQRTWIFPA